MATLSAPVRVSPLIKTVRWTGLISGVLYGASHFNTLNKKETAFREEAARLAELRAPEVAKEKARALKEELQTLEKESGVKLT